MKSRPEVVAALVVLLRDFERKAGRRALCEELEVQICFQVQTAGTWIDATLPIANDAEVRDAMRAIRETPR